MMPMRGQSACDGAAGEQVADAMGVAFQQVAQGLGRLQEQEAERRLQEVLGLQEQEAERRLQDALRLQEQEALRLQEQRTATMLGEAVLRLEEKLQEKDDAIRALQQHLLVVEERVTAVEEGSKASERLENRMEKVEASLKRAMDQFLPRVEALLCHVEKPSRPEATQISSPALVAANAIGGEDAGARVEERERQWVRLRVRELEERMARARAFPCPLGEDLCKAAVAGELNDVLRLLDLCANVNYTNGWGWTPLMTACSGEGKLITMSLLLGAGANPNTVNVFGDCALHIACERSFLYVPLLIRAGADVDARDANGATPLHWAAHKSNEAAARALVAAGARKDIKGWGGLCNDRTPFDVAHSDALRELLRP